MSTHLVRRPARPRGAEHLVQLVDDGGVADAEIAGNQHQPSAALFTMRPKEASTLHRQTSLFAVTPICDKLQLVRQFAGPALHGLPQPLSHDGVPLPGWRELISA
jgi:hypothetical protein